MICIDGKFAPDVWEWAAAIPREGEIYTIQRIYNGMNRITDRREPGVDLVEVDTLPARKPPKPCRPADAQTVSGPLPTEIKKPYSCKKTNRNFRIIARRAHKFGNTDTQRSTKTDRSRNLLKCSQLVSGRRAQLWQAARLRESGPWPPDLAASRQTGSPEHQCASSSALTRIRPKLSGPARRTSPPMVPSESPAAV